MQQIFAGVSGKVKINLPDAVAPGVPFEATAADKRYSATWHPQRGVLILTHPHGLEQMLRIRSVVRERFDDDVETQLDLEVMVTAAAGTCILKGTFTPDLPGMRNGPTGAASGEKTVRSQITGKVLKVCAGTGALVTREEPLLIIEAMKMENRIFTPVAGTLVSVSVREGDNVTTGQELFRVKAGS